MRTRSWVSGCCHSGSTSSATGVSTLKGALISFTESPRSALKPMVSFTSAVSFSSSSAGIGVVVDLPFASVVVRWFTTTAAFRRVTVPVAARVTRTVLSTS